MDRSGDPEPGGDTDLVLVGGRVHTPDPGRPRATSVLVRDGRIAHVGGDADTLAQAGPRARVHSLRGRVVLPGLIDAHTHPGLVTGSRDVFLLPRTDDIEVILARVAAAAAARPDAPILFGGYFAINAFGLEGPRRERLDAAAPRRAVILYDDSGHSQWLSTAALERLGIGAATPDPVPGLSCFVRDPDGTPTGWTKEFALQPFLRDHGAAAGTPAEPPDELEAFLVDLARHGVVALLDGGSQDAEETVYRRLAELDRDGRLPLRYEGAVHVTQPDQVPEAADRLLELRRANAGERLRFNTVKLVLDGVTEVGTAAMLDPYRDPAGGRGATLVDGAAVEALILRLHAIGANLHLHTVGDAAVRVTLDAVARARAVVGPLRSRVSVAHVEVVHPADMPRFSELGVVVNVTPHWYGGYFEGAERWLGPDRYRRMYQLRTLAEAGAVLACSSDITDHVEWTSGRANPFLGIQVGHTRRDVGGGPARAPEAEAISRGALVEGYTRGAAVQLGLEHELGSLRPGRPADLVVLDRDLFEIDAEAIHAVRPAAVVVGGRVAHGELP